MTISALCKFLSVRIAPQRFNIHKKIFFKFKLKFFFSQGCFQAQNNIFPSYILLYLKYARTFMLRADCIIMKVEACKQEFYEMEENQNEEKLEAFPFIDSGNLHARSNRACELCKPRINPESRAAAQELLLQHAQSSGHGADGRL